MCILYIIYVNAHLELDKDKFFVGDRCVKWIYSNPDSNAGEQYVYNMLSTQLISSASEAVADVSDFYDRLGGECTQYLVDRGTFDFEEIEHFFDTVPDDFEDCTESSMERLISPVQARAERE
ncbi:MAG: hypothetical protein LBU32_24960 [Clostridiales bacterium]|jgi:hypothetical protein|nr:hypothetical protein [Clostridiales bacterium]